MIPQKIIFSSGLFCHADHHRMILNWVVPVQLAQLDATLVRKIPWCDLKHSLSSFRPVFFPHCSWRGAPVLHHPSLSSTLLAPLLF
jgi:hypothetical protein